MCKNNFRKLGYHPLEGKELFLSNKIYSKSTAMLTQQTIYFFYFKNEDTRTCQLTSCYSHTWSKLNANTRLMC